MKKKAMKPVSLSIKKWMKDAKFRDAFNALEPEFAIARAIIEARIKSKLSQKELAKRMKTTQPMIARLEAARQKPSVETLLKFAKATGTRLQIEFVEA